MTLPHAGDDVALVAKMPAPFDADHGDSVGLQIAGGVHLFDASGERIASTTATLR